MKWVVFTDLDGTLLDPVTYSYEKSLHGIMQLKSKDIPMIFCSAKTRAEQEIYRRELGVFHPFIVENGGAVFIPQAYFPFSFDYHKTVNDLLVIELGSPYKEIRRLLVEVREEGKFHFRGFGDMTVEEVAQETGLDIESANLAKQREYSETVKFDSGEELHKILKELGKLGLTWTHGGRFYEVMGKNDKGKAVKLLINLYGKMWNGVKSVGLGDSLSDLSMLSLVDVPILVQKKDGSWEDVDLPHLRKVPGIGPEGWSEAIESELRLIPH
jgi:mannosyl-3-phosphoglycerate phosphatase